ncbi:hypothetical protein WMY93_015789 [Mugilogobius chulae]|uniref:PB1 domain-containing protein n=1 Tax=Mugilogobius chulae TaxID=88201 RepID=A0AAW0NTP7_9GOBI
MFLPTGIPETVEELIDHVRMLCSVEGNFRLQYQDRDFDNALVNLTSTSELNDCSTIKVIPLDIPQDSEITSDEISLASSDTEMLSSPSSSVAGRTKMWPRVFVIPTFSYDTELQLEKANEVYKSNMMAFNPSSKTKSDILDRLAEEIFQYKAYPDDFDFSDVAEALIKKHPCLTEPGPYNGAYGWKQRMKTKMGNYRTHLKGIGCSELLANSLKSKRPDDALPAKKVKRPRRGEANHIPDIPNGETAEKLENERLALLTEFKKVNNRAVIKEKMAKTFYLRRQEVVEKEMALEELLRRWPALFTSEEINLEFQRVTTVPLQSRFLAALDNISPKVVTAIENRGGVVREKTRNIMAAFHSTQDVDMKRECVLRALIWYLGEDEPTLIKDYLISQHEEAERELELCTIAIYTTRSTAGLLEPPHDIGVIIEGPLVGVAFDADCIYNPNSTG